jgi:hypothetical protein
MTGNAGSSTYRSLVLGALGSLALSQSAVSGEPTMGELQWHRRVLLVSAPSSSDPSLLAEEQALASWKGGDERDVSVVHISGDTVSGSSESAAELRRRYQLTASAFSVALVGKDGHVALRSSTVVTGTHLAAVIDRMPMRRAGQR